MEVKKLALFDYLNSINDTKVDLIVDEQSEKTYVPFIINKGLSYFGDTILLANEMNRLPATDKKMQYDFLRLTIRKKKRFSKWDKEVKSEDIALMKRVYSCNEVRALEALALLTPEQLQNMHKKYRLGGKQ